jgi:tyrosyl-tRNA synthetase
MKQETISWRFVENAYPSREALEKILNSDKKLKIYLGVDPTGPHLHLGHATNLLLLRQLQNLGHKIIFLIGDFTGRIGDPTDKLAARQPLTERQIKENLKTFKSQAAKIIRFSGKNPATVAFNSKWHKNMTFERLIELAHYFTVQQMIERDMFQKRLKEEKPIGLHEFFYPLMQGYDSVALNVDMEIGGNDQTFNMLAGRTLLKIYKNKEKFVITTKLLVNPETGKKIMNKSEGGLINLDDDPQNMFGKVMALDDRTMFILASLSTLMPDIDITKMRSEVEKGTLNPKDAKLKIAHAVVSLYHSPTASDKAEAGWVKTFSKRELPDEIEVQAIPSDILASSGTTAMLVAIGAAKSNSEARRLISQGAVKVGGRAVSDPNEKRKDGEIIKVGKHRFFKLKKK